MVTLSLGKKKKEEDEQEKRSGGVQLTLEPRKTYTYTDSTTGKTYSRQDIVKEDLRRREELEAYQQSYNNAYNKALQEEIQKQARQADWMQNYTAQKEYDWEMNRDASPVGDAAARVQRAKDYAASSPLAKYQAQPVQSVTGKEVKRPKQKVYTQEKSVPSDVLAQNAAWQDERDSLIDRFTKDMEAFSNLSQRANSPGYRSTAEDQAIVDNWKNTLLDVEKRGGIENLYQLQQNDYENDRNYGARMRGNDPGNMTFLDKAFNVVGGILSGAGTQMASSALGTYQGLQNANIMRAEEGYTEGLKQVVNNYLGAIANDPEGQNYGTQAIRDSILTQARVLGGDDYANRLIGYIDDMAKIVRADNPRASFSDYYAGMDPSSVPINPTAAWENLNKIAGSEGVYRSMFALQDKSSAATQRAKDMMQSRFGDMLVDAGTSAVQSSADALISAAMGLSGTGLIAMAPFAARAFGGGVAEASRNIHDKGQEIGKEMARNINRYATASAAIEVGTEMLWGSVGAMSGVTGGGALDEYTTKKLTDALSRSVKSETGARILSTLGEKVMGGVFEGLEEFIADAANWLLNTSGIYTGEEREEIGTAFKNALTSFATGAMSGWMGEVSKVATSPMQNSLMGRGVRKNTGELYDLLEAAQSSDGELGRVYDQINQKSLQRQGMDVEMPSLDAEENFSDQADRFSNRELGKLYQTYLDTLSNEGVADISRAVQRVKDGKTLTENDVRRIVRDQDAMQYLEDVTGKDITSQENVTDSAIEALNGLASRQNEAQEARAENDAQIAKNRQNVLWARAGRDETRMMPSAESRQSVIQTDEALERMGITGESAEIITEAFIPGQNALEYAGDAVRFFNQGKNGKEMDPSSIGKLAMNITPGQAMAAYNAGRMERIGEEYNGSETEEGNGLRLRGGVQRDGSESAGGQAGTVAGEARSLEAREELAGFRGGRKVAGVRSGPVSTKELGLRGGTGKKNIQIIQESNSKDYKEARDIVEAQGLKFVGFVGGALEIEHVTKYGNKLVTQARGYYDPENKTVYVRMDHRVFTGAQLAKHEAMHDKIRKGEVNLEAARDMMRDSLGTDKFVQSLDAYSALYEGTDLSQEEVFEEMICDAAGNMNEFMYQGHMEDAMKNLPAMKAAREAGKNAKGEGRAEDSAWIRHGEGKASSEIDKSSIKKQIDDHVEELNKMPVVKSVSVVLNNFSSKDEAAKWVIDQLKKWGGHVDREGYGNIYFSDRDIRDGLKYSKTDAEIAAMVVLPYVLKRGIQVGEHWNHKDRAKHTITFAAPVEVNGTRGNMAVVVNKNGDHYYAHRIVLPDGTAFVFSNSNAKASRELHRGVTDSSSLANATRLASAPTVPNQQEEVKQIIETLGDSGAYNSEAGAKFSREMDTEILKKLNSGPTIKLYRAMQEIDGKLYPPMAAKVEGKMVEPTQMGEWYRADERPDLAKNGKFKLDKANGSSITAAYNPYFHTSRSPLNDQFSSAYKRPNLVTVEVEVPASELTSGYKAEGAKDSVGEMSWHSGPVSSKLTGDKSRKVVLSRWAKVNRVVPDAEVASNIAEMLEGENITIPANTVTPSLRAELENRGVQVAETQGKMSRELKSEQKRAAGEKLTEKQFYSLYSAHKLDMRKSGNVEEQIRNIREEGFKGDAGFGHNLMPTQYSVSVDKDGNRIPGNVSVAKYGPKKGDYILLVPRSGTEITKTYDRVKPGYKPMFDYEIVRADYDYQPYYEMYSKAYDKAASETQGKMSREANPDREKLARKLFGTTADFREAGYLMRNGSMLDFSGKRDGGPSRVRYMDHREIAEAFSEDEISDEDTRYGSNTAYMNAFIDEGNIRLMDSQGVTIGEMEPTAQQYTVLKRFIDYVLGEEEYFYLDLSNKDGFEVSSREYYPADGADRVIRDIKAYFKNGELPYKSELSQFRYSRDLDKTLQELYPEYRNDKENLKLAEEGIENLISGLDRISSSGREVVHAGKRRQNKVDIRTIARGISTDFIQKGRVNLNGVKIKNAADLAQVGQIFRNPQFETMRYVYVKNGRVVGTDSISAKLPGLSPVFSSDFQGKDLVNKINRVGADEVFLLHNHPSGDVSPSVDDFKATRWLAKHISDNTNARIGGHIIIDHDVYTELTVDTSAGTFAVNEEKKNIPQSSFDFLLSPSIDNDNLSKRIGSIDQVAAMGRDMNTADGYSAIIYADKNGRIRQLQEVSDKALLSNKQMPNYIRNQRREVGAGMAFVYTKNDSVFREMLNTYKSGILLDVVYDGTYSVLSMRQSTSPDKDMYMGYNESDLQYMGIHANEGPAKYSRDLGDTALYEQNRELRKEMAEWKRKYKAKSEQRDYWHGQTKTTDGRRVRMDSAKRMARDILKGHNSQANAEEVATKLKDLAEFCWNSHEFDDAFYEEARQKSYEIAHEVLNQSKILVETGGEEFYKDFRDYLRATQMYVPPSVQKDLTPDKWNDYRKSLFGTMNLSAANTSAMGIDVAYQELQEKFGESLFPDDITNPADQVRRMLEIVETYKPVYENWNSYDMAEAVEWTANEILTRVVGEEMDQLPPTFADKKDAKLKEQREKYQATLKEVRRKRDERIKAMQEKSRNSLQRVRQQRDDKISNIKEHYKEVAEARKARKEDSELRTRLLNLARRVNSMKVPRVAGVLRDQIMGELDLVAKSITGRKLADLRALSDWYNEQKEQDPNFFQDKQIEKDLKRLEKKQIKDMSQEEVSTLIRVLQNFETEWRLKKEGKFIDSSIITDRYISALTSMNDIAATKGRTSKRETARWLSNFFIDNQLSSDRAMKRLTGYRDGDPLRVLMKEVEKGHTAKIDFTMKANKLLGEFLDDKEFARGIMGKKARSITVVGAPGAGQQVKRVEITPAMAIGLYLSSRNDDNMRHIAQGGILIPDMGIYRKGNKGLAYEKGELLKFTKEAIREVESQLTDKEKAFANKIYEYYNRMAPNAINAVSEKLVGFPKAMVKNYYPIKVLSTYLKSDFGAIAEGGTPQSFGFLQDRIDSADNPVVLADCVDVLRQSIDQNGTYVGLAIPIRNFELLYNTNAKTETGKLESVKQSLEYQWGDYATKYIDKVIRDVQGKKEKAKEFDKAINKARGNQAKSALYINAGTAIKQAASGPTAAATLGAGPVIKAFLNPVSLARKVDPNLINRYTPLYEYRALGYSSSDIGEIAQQKHDLPKLLKWIEAIDLLTVRRIWRACEYYVLENNKDLKPYSHEFYEAVKDKWEQTVQETQPNYTPMQRSQSLRSEGIERSLHLFKTQPYQNFGILYDAVGEFRAKHQQMLENTTPETEARFKEAKVNLARAVGSQIVSSFVFSLMQFAVDWLRGKRKKYKDDEDELTLLSWLKGMGLNMLNNGAGMVPLGGLMLEGIESGTDAVLKALGKDAFFEQRYWGISEPTIDALNESGNFVGNLLSKITAFSNDKMTTETFARAMVDSFTEVSDLAGVPVGNTLRTMQSMARFVMEAGAKSGMLFDGNTIMAEYYSLRMSTDPSKYKSDYYNLLKKAFDKSDDGTYEEIYKMMIDESGFETESKSSKENIDSSIKKWGYTLLEETWNKDRVEYQKLRQRFIDMPGDPFATGTKSAEENITSKEKQWAKQDIQSSTEEKTFYQIVYDEMTTTGLWASATKQQQDKALETLLSMAVGKGDPEYDEAGYKKYLKASGGASVGLDETEYMLFTIALDMANEDGGKPTNSELEAAIRMMNGLSDAERSYLWMTERTSDKNNPWK